MTNGNLLDNARYCACADQHLVREHIKWWVKSSIRHFLYKEVLMYILKLNKFDLIVNKDSEANVQTKSCFGGNFFIRYHWFDDLYFIQVIERLGCLLHEIVKITHPLLLTTKFAHLCIYFTAISSICSIQIPVKRSCLHIHKQN